MDSVAAAVAALRAEHPSVGGSGWDFDGFRVWVESNEPKLLAELDAYFVDFRRIPAAHAEAGSGPITRITAIQAAPPDFANGHTPTLGEYKPSVKGPKEAYFDVDDGRVVHKLRTGMWFLFGRDHHLAIGPCTDNPNQVINFVNNRMIQWALHRGALLGHGSAVCHAAGPDSGALPRALAIAGFSGMGKSTLALHLMNDRRLDFVSNDRVMIQPRSAGEHGRVELEGVPKHPRINPGTILNNPALAGVIGPNERAQFEALPRAELWQLEHKYDGLIGACFPEQRFRLRAELGALILLNWQLGAGPAKAARIDVRERPELLLALMKEPGVFYRPGPGEVPTRDVDRYIEFLAGVEVLELSGGVDFDLGRAAALELLGL